MIYELRIYRLYPSQKKTFLNSFKKAKSFMKKYGTNFVAAWESVAREDECIWIRAFPSLEVVKTPSNNNALNGVVSCTGFVPPPRKEKYISSKVFLTPD